MKYLLNIALAALGTMHLTTQPPNVDNNTLPKSPTTSGQTTTQLPQPTHKKVTQQTPPKPPIHLSTNPLDHTPPRAWYHLALPVDDTIILRSLEPKDSKALFNLAEANKPTIYPYMANWFEDTYTTLPQTVDILQTHEDSWQDFCQNVVIDKKRWLIPKAKYIVDMGIWKRSKDTLEEELIGWIGAHRLYKNPHRVMLGYWLAREHTGQNTMTKSCFVLTDYLFATIPDLQQVDIWTDDDNKASTRIAEKLCFARKNTYPSNYHMAKRATWSYDKRPSQSPLIASKKMTPTDATPLYTFIQQQKSQGNHISSYLSPHDTLDQTYNLIQQRNNVATQLQAKLPDLVWPREEQTIFSQWMVYTYDTTTSQGPDILGWIGMSHYRESNIVRLNYWLPDQQDLLPNFWMTFPDVIQDVFDTYPPISTVILIADNEAKQKLAEAIGCPLTYQHNYVHFTMPRYFWEAVRGMLKAQHKIYGTHAAP